MLVVAIMSVFILYSITFIFSFLNINAQYPGFIHDSSPLGIAFSLFVVGIASLSFVLDFDFIERSAASDEPKYMEWYGAFGIMVTLVWLYIEILRLLAKLRRRR